MYDSRAPGATYPTLQRDGGVPGVPGRLRYRGRLPGFAAVEGGQRGGERALQVPVGGP